MFKHRYSMQVWFMVFTLFLTTNAMAWTKHLTFESGLEGTTGFHWAGARQFVKQSATVAHEGTYSAEFHFKHGDTCWENRLTCGAGYNFDEVGGNLGEGDELWVRGYYFFPDGWDWGSVKAAEKRKILRFRVDGRGYLSVIAVWEGGSHAQVESSSEIEPDYAHWTGSYFTQNSGKWYSVEQYVKFSTSSSVAVHRIWLDGVLVSEHAPDHNPHGTLESAADVVSSILFFTYWNGGKRTSQSAYIDDVVITTDKPAQVDSLGNSMIGPSVVP